MCRDVVAVVLGVGVWAFPVSGMSNVAVIADTTDKMMKIRLTELFHARMGSSSVPHYEEASLTRAGRISGFQPDMFPQDFCLGFSAG
jgi:hypothetical protein